MRQTCPLLKTNRLFCFNRGIRFNVLQAFYKRQAGSELFLLSSNKMRADFDWILSDPVSRPRALQVAYDLCVVPNQYSKQRTSENCSRPYALNMCNGDRSLIAPKCQLLSPVRLGCHVFYIVCFHYLFQHLQCWFIQSLDCRASIQSLDRSCLSFRQKISISLACFHRPRYAMRTPAIDTFRCERSSNS